jgi:hypothetical protein
MWVSAAWAGAQWPSLAEPGPVGGGEADAALVIGIGDYWAVPDVPGAADNARDWYTWFTEARATPADRVRLLVDAEATRESVLDALGRLTPGPGGTRWVVFVGHGAPARDGRDGLLLGADVRQTADSIEDRSVTRRELLGALGGGPAVVILDACFSGRDPTGAALVPGLQPLIPTWATDAGPQTVLSAGGPDQFAGPLPGAARPAFSYLVLGALQGWGDADRDGAVTASEAVAYAGEALRATVVDRAQDPQRTGEDRVLAPVGRARAPELGALRLAATPARPLRAPTTARFEATGLGVDVEVEQAYAAALAVDQRPLAPGSSVRDAWCRLARLRDGEHGYGPPAAAACEEWTEWTRAVEGALDDLERDYEALRTLLPMDTVDDARKAAAAEAVSTSFAGFEAAAPSLAAVDRARRHLASGRRARLPAWSPPLPHELRGGSHGVFFPAWDPLLAKFPATQLSVGVGVERGVPGAVACLTGFLLGPFDLGLLSGSSLGEGFTYRFHAGVMPFAVRTSRRHPGELRGSVINPLLGAGLSTGSRPTGTETTAPSTDLTWLDLYAADLVFVTNGLGLRGEARLPVLPLDDGARAVAPGPQLALSVVLNAAAGMR